MSNVNLIRKSNKSMRERAFDLGATEFGKSRTKNKKFYVVYGGRVINFGQRGYSDFTKHKDEDRREAYMKRHKAIKNKEGKLVYKDKSSPSFWALNLLWK